MKSSRIIVAWLLVAAISETALAYEEPPYTVETRNEGFEVRRYAPYLVAETDLPGDFSDSRNDAFRRLFGYISGRNVAQQEIEMTIPVVTSPVDGDGDGDGGGDGETIEMTAPVVTQTDAAGRTMQFVLPSRYTLATAPQPSDPRVRIRALGERWFAVRTYSGTWSERNFRKNEIALLEQIEAAGLVVVGPSAFAAYDSPFTFWFMRRNEVMVPIRPSMP